MKHEKQTKMKGRMQKDGGEPQKIDKKMSKEHEQMHHHNHHQVNHDSTGHTAMDNQMHEEHIDHMQMDHSSMNHASHMENFKQKFWLSLIIALPIIILSPMMGLSLPFQVTFTGSQWLVLGLATFLYFYGGAPFLKGAKMELQMKSPAMMTLISLGISVAYIYSVYAFMMNEVLHTKTHVMDFFWELATLIVIMLLGHWIEMNAVGNASNALQKMAELLPNKAWLVDDTGEEKEVPLKEVSVGATVLVKPGEKIPTDGVILSGKTTVNEALVTGEAKAVQKNVADSVIGGALNGSGSLSVKVTGTGESGYLAQVMALVSQAQKEKSHVESLSDKVAKWLFYVALVVSLLAFTIWLFLADLNTALERMVTVLIIACPHALGLAIPLVTARSTSLGAKNGLLIKKRQALEVAPKLDVIMMDKTGTLTAGRFAVNTIMSFNPDYDSNKLLAYFAALEKNSSHPLAAGIIKEAQLKNIVIPTAVAVENIPGVGLVGKIAEETVKIASISYLKAHGYSFDQGSAQKLSAQGNSLSFLLVEEQVVGVIAQGDQIKPQAHAMIATLISQGIQPVMLTGDNEEVAHQVATQLGIKDVHAELLPIDKEAIVKSYQAKGLTVMMVGDGVNDAPSLVRADIGVAIGAGTDVALDSADVILVKSEPADILHLLSLAKNTQRKMIQNLWWGAGYNIIAIPLAAGVLAGIGLILSPAVGAILMSLSTIIVALNAMTLKLNT